jgi:hypothetical protein
VTENSRILAFYREEASDHRGRYLQEILSWPDERLEVVHDYIQWLFPLSEPSGFNVSAPVLTPATIDQFRGQPELQKAVRSSFLRMLDFFGFQIRSTNPLDVKRRPDFSEKSERWLTQGNHNHLRITRILKSLHILGLQREAKAFFDCVSEIYEEERRKSDPTISDETMLYWRRAVNEQARRLEQLPISAGFYRQD